MGIDSMWLQECAAPRGGRSRILSSHGSRSAATDLFLGRSRATTGHTRTPYLNFLANDRVVSRVEHFMQFSAVDLIETNKHDWIVLVMRFQIEGARIVFD